MVIFHVKRPFWDSSLRDSVGRNTVYTVYHIFWVCVLTRRATTSSASYGFKCAFFLRHAVSDQSTMRRYKTSNYVKTSRILAVPLGPATHAHKRHSFGDDDVVGGFIADVSIVKLRSLGRELCLGQPVKVKDGAQNSKSPRVFCMAAMACMY